MNRLTLGGVLFATALVTANAVWAQATGGESFRGSLPEGEVDRSLVPPTFPGETRAIPTPKLDPESTRSLPFSDPGALERGFGTVTRGADGEVTREVAAPEVLDALRKKADINENSMPKAEDDPLFAADEEQRAIVGEDNRIRVPNTTIYPYRAVGLLLTERGSCSATLIGPRTLVTAAHCVYSHEKGGWANETVFYPGANGEGNFPYRGYDYQESTIPQGYIDNWQGFYGSVVPWDIAVITLQEAAGDDVGWLGFSENNGRDFGAYNIGYPGDKPFGSQWRDKCDVSSFEIAGTEYIHRCDTKPGSSGSSMYRYVKNGSQEERYVEGINVAEVETGNRSTNYNIGVLFTTGYFDFIYDLWQ